MNEVVIIPTQGPIAALLQESCEPLVTITSFDLVELEKLLNGVSSTRPEDIQHLLRHTAGSFQRVAA